MPSAGDLALSGAPDVDRDHQDGRTLGDKFHPWRTRGANQHPQIRSLIAKHYEQLSSGLVDIFRTEVEREVKQRVSEFIVSEATVFCEQLKSKDEALLAAELRNKDLQEQLEFRDRMCRHLQEKVQQLEMERQLGVALSEQPEIQQAGAASPPLESRHLAIVYERRENRMICRLCVDGHSKNNTLPIVSFKDDVKLSTLTLHIQHQHPQDYEVLFNMEENELREVAREMSQVGNPPV